jgi:ubiquinone/menaquinone biosynthesis C-methylase UbiE
MVSVGLRGRVWILQYPPSFERRDPWVPYMLSREQVRSFYDQFGAKQDWQRFYEGPAIRDLLAHGAFEKARAVFEFGCGTGWFAEHLLAYHLPESATYLCFDLSSTMVTLTKARLAKYGNRAQVHLTDGSLELPLPDLEFNRFVSNYVLDLLPPEDIHIVLQEAHRILTPGGRLCLISLTHGLSPLSRTLSWVWKLLFSVRPSLVGGCRPVELLEFISKKMWQVVHHHSVVTFGIPSEVVVACKLPPCHEG